ncbi:gamma-glutamyl-gamma-aminobutyrate hydrolase family protein [Candidatus Berkiella aquae]|uniref:Gamma-glutamyl-gamma-aminobutyrate hydrolase PuuD n=1 Tax=Candidatus Berkiella aquae TaxID=295108 RepID=A0A0Q9YL90_9GAMM|nr:gamma-glutamyl-gamma-aminobutyrate hydrolase family protein [Candidatus Berkiella aquae]MCS5711019.1 gamma-glutamyl-gamma-aminobutyrate hydrolase family protein [Candidatus Berkiella aquae]
MFRLIWSIVISCVLITVGQTAYAQDASEKPLIGILLNDGGKGGYSQYPWYAMRKNYSAVIAKMGGVPVFIGHDVTVADDYLNRLDAIVLPGGDLDSPPSAHKKNQNATVDPKRYPREAIEFKLIQEAYRRDMPVLGICAGMQNMNVALGGTLHNLKASGQTKMEHRHDNREKIQHTIKVEPNSLLYKVVQSKQFGVNSNHRSGINELASRYVVTARAPDGVIEAIEAQNKSFFIGVIWHPEYVLTPQEEKLWKAFIQAAVVYKKEHKKS